MTVSERNRPPVRPSAPQRNEDMPKQKTKRAAMKRFKRTGSGKLKRWHANHSHILTKKTRKRKNRLKKGDLVSSADFPRVNRLLQA
jgi:large subunit ribosomal protein L35